MITEIQLENVRIFEGPGWKFPLAPINVFCGTNSAGKSTVLKVLLLLRQSLGIRESSAAAPARLRFIGTQADLGSYYSFVSHNDIGRDVSIGITAQGKASMAFMSMIPGFRAQNYPVESAQSEDALWPYLVKCDFTFGIVRPVSQPELFDSEHGESVVVHPSTRKSSAVREVATLKQSRFAILFHDDVLLSWEVKLSTTDEGGKPSYQLLLPPSYFESAPWAEAMEKPSMTADGLVCLDAVLRGPLPDRIMAPFKRETGSEPEQMGVWPLPPHVEEALSDLRRALVAVHYLGPLRSPAKRYYVTQVDEMPMDPTGEFLPYALRDRAERDITNVSPGEKEPRSEKLSDALNGWMYYLRTGECCPSELRQSEVSVEPTKEVLVEFKVKTVSGNESHALMDSGFGYSQVLPILVRGLLARSGNTVLIEQPEVHLNPALQVRLVAFFVAMSRAGKQIIIETHSEHIVNALRVQAAEDESGQLSLASNIYFLDAEATPPHVRVLQVQQDGTVPDWPKNFFGEAISLSGRLLRSQGRFRAKKTTSD